MELRHIRYFLAVAQEKNFTRAAEKLMIAQPPLSRQIKDLEDELGVVLFERRPHALTLTEEGHVFYQYATRVMDLVARSQEDVRDVHAGLHGTVYLAGVEGHAPALFARWIAGFHQLHPHVQFHLWNGNSDDVTHRLSKGLCELALIMEPHNEEHVNSLHVYDEPWVAMIPASCPLAAGSDEEVDFQALLDYDLIIPSRLSRLEEIAGWADTPDREIRIRCRIANMINAYELTRSGVGIAIFPASANIGTDPGVVIKRLRNPHVDASYVLLWSKHSQLSHAAEEFLQYIQDAGLQ